MPNIILQIPEDLNETIEHLKEKYKIKSKADVIVRLIKKGVERVEK